jgi:hypothetical protein
VFIGNIFMLAQSDPFKRRTIVGKSWCSIFHKPRFSINSIDIRSKYDYYNSKRIFLSWSHGNIPVMFVSPAVLPFFHGIVNQLDKLVLLFKMNL